ncbi:MAG: BatA and WFA domain-containing protein [Clostridia bacterium]|nr:BatA and WFA domain-containing protein [Clostridia bacterium]
MRIYEWLGLLGLIAVPIVIIIYLLKSKYVPKTVSSTFIWKRSLKYMKRRIPVNFIMSMLLIIQLLTVLAATFALMDARIEKDRGEDVIYIVDASASMELTKKVQTTGENGKTKTVEMTRYEWAIDDISKKASTISEKGGMCVIVAADTPQLLTKTILGEGTDDEETIPYVFDPTQMGQIIAQLREKSCSNKGTDINEALKLTQEAIDTNPEAKIVIYSDKDFLTEGDSEIQVIRCDDRKNDQNVGITSFVEKKTDVNISFEVSLEAQGENQSYEFDVVFELDGVEMDRRKIEMSTSGYDSEGNSMRSKTITFGPVKVSQYERARVYINVKDIIADDNEAYLYFVPEQSLNVIYVSNQLSFTDKGKIDYDKTTILQRSLRSSGISIPQENIYHSKNVDKAPTSGYDLYIYEGTAPLVMPTDGAVWYINASGTPTGTNLHITDVVKDGKDYKFDEAVLLGDYSRGILKNVDYGKEGALLSPVIRSFSLIGAVGEDNGKPVLVNGVPDNFEVIFTAAFEQTSATGQTEELLAPIMLAGTVGTTRVLVTTFEFTNVNTTMHFDVTNFILLMRNIKDFSTPDILPERSPDVGDTLEFNPPSGIESIKYVYFTPEEEAARYTGERGNGTPEHQWNKADGSTLPTVSLDKLGLYEIQVTYQTNYITDASGNLIDGKQETETFSVYTSPSSTETILGNTVLTTLQVPAKGLSDATAYVRYHSILPWVILVLIVLLIIEWGVYYRDEY